MKLKHGGAIVAMALATVGVVRADAPGAPYMLAGSGQRFAALQDAVNAIGEGSGTIVIAPGAYRDCAVQTRGDVAFVAAVPGQVVFDGQPQHLTEAVVQRLYRPLASADTPATSGAESGKAVPSALQDRKSTRLNSSH